MSDNPLKEKYLSPSEENALLEDTTMVSPPRTPTYRRQHELIRSQIQKRRALHHRNLKKDTKLQNELTKGEQSLLNTREALLNLPSIHHNREKGTIKI